MLWMSSLLYNATVVSVFLLWGTARAELGIPTFHKIITPSSSSFDFDLQLIPVPKHVKEAETKLITIPLSKVGGGEKQNSKNIDAYDTTEHAYILQSTGDDWSVVVPSSSSQRRLRTTSHQAAEHQCDWATNGGPFHSDGSPVGAVVVNHGKIISNDFDNQVGFGLLRNPTKINTNTSFSNINNDTDYSWVIGTVVKNDIHHKRIIQNLDYFVTGFDWLVYQGQNVANYVNNTTGAERAPRTAIGVDAMGRLLLVVTDGCERCILQNKKKRGLTLVELGDLLIQQGGAQFAINMDGGSSTVMTMKNQTWISHPTCMDYLPLRCERPVATVLCIRRRRRRRDGNNINDDDIVQQQRQES